MAFYKKCSCGKISFFNRPMDYPDNCSECGRRLSDSPTMNEDDNPILPEKKEQQESKELTLNATSDSSSSNNKQFALFISDGIEISIPDGESIIGRTEVGAEQLASYSSVSRKHLKVKTKRGKGLIVEDISSYGTLIDGIRINKNELKLVNIGSKITLCDLETTLITKEVK